MERIVIRTNPQLFDRAVAPIQKLLADRLSWLDHSIGICEILTDVKEGRKFTSANLYKGKGHYEQIAPSESLGNFSFFVLRDPQEVNGNRIKSQFSLIVWYDMRKVSHPTDERNREAIKGQILGVINALHNPNLVITKIYENPKNIFADFSYEHTDNQFLMSPFAGVRIDGEISTVLPCYVGDYNDDYNYDFYRV